MSTTQPQYASAAQVPLIKSPSLRVPRPVEFPVDIHPLPEDITAYFVYPFTIEQHVIAVESSRRSQFAANAARHQACLKAREEEKERRARMQLRKVAPGFEPNAGVLVPQRQSLLFPGGGDTQKTEGKEGTKDVMDDLVEQLARLENKSSVS